jgi:phosphoglycerol transferase MdoB-like AlkP superfamily enzyme
MVGVLCGHPDIGGPSVLGRERALRRFHALPEVLRHRGYRTLFFYGGDPDFDNMRGFFQNHGIERTVGQEELGPDHAGNWGVPDEMIFQRAHEKFQALHRSRQQGGPPFFSVILTVSNHQPYEVPAGRVEMEFGEDQRVKARNAYRYADWALGQFMRRAAGSAYGRDTLFVLVADHGRFLDPRALVDIPGFRVPCLFLAPGRPELTPPQTVGTICSQVDIAPTVLALLGGRYEHCFLGRNLLRLPPERGLAYMHHDGRLALRVPGAALVLPPLCPPVLYRAEAGTLHRVPAARAPTAEVHRLRLHMLSYYGTARQLYLDGTYGEPVALPASRPWRKGR